MATWTYIKNLNLILQTGKQDCSLYANGRNAVMVILTFDPLDENKKLIDGPSIKWGNQTKLVDYITVEDLTYGGTSGWVYNNNTPTYNAIPPSLGGMDTAESHKAPGNSGATPSGKGGEVVSQAATKLGNSQYSAYILCYPDAGAQKAIGIKITTDGGNTYYSTLNWPSDATKDGSVHQKLTITPLVQVNYDLNNCSTTQVDNVKTTNYQNQRNYFLQIKDGRFKIQNVDINCPTGPDPWSIISKDKAPNWHIIWPYDGSGQTQTGWFTGGFGFSYSGDDLYYNQMPNSLCVTRFWHDKGTNTGYLNEYYECRFDIYDQYGNTGHFSLARCESNWGDSIVFFSGDHESKNGC
ncbi:hypothetical protein [Burkholderia ubonensis]|uniref:hypothetical protein n=1 Tax=Burkholderia ubonensis TaxID=101571 RepID=UPI000B05BD75|nr:hypothetical protein [Burkholderia ubonensis]